MKNEIINQKRAVSLHVRQTALAVLNKLFPLNDGAR